MSNLYREPAIYASYQVTFIWPNGFRVEEFFRNRPITLKRNYGSVFLTQNYELQFSFNYNNIQHIGNYKQQFSISFFFLHKICCVILLWPIFNPSWSYTISKYYNIHLHILIIFVWTWPQMRSFHWLSSPF